MQGEWESPASSCASDSFNVRSRRNYTPAQPRTIGAGNVRSQRREPR